MSAQKISLASLALTIALNIAAQESVFVNYNVKEGLAQSQVRDIIQSRDGYLWVATVGGASRFDGNSFTTFNKTKGLINNLVTALYETSENELVIGGKGGFTIRKGDETEQITFPTQFQNALIFDIVELNDEILLATNGYGILRYKDRNFTQIDLGNTDQNFVRSICQVGETILAGTKSGLISINQLEVKLEIDSLSIYRIVSDGENTWITTDDHGVLWMNNGSVRHLTAKDGLPSDHQRDVCIDKQGNPWFITKNVITKFDMAKQRFVQVDAVNADHVSNLKVLFSDRESNIWVGTDGNGILKYTGDQFATFTNYQGYSFETVMNISEQRDGSMWFATYGQGVNILRNGNIENLDYKSGLQNSTVWSLASLSNGQMWIGTSEGISIYDDGKLASFKHNETLPFPRVSAIFQDSRNQIWIGTRDGVMVCDEQQNLVNTSAPVSELQEVKGFVEHEGIIYMASGSGLFCSDLTGQIPMNISIPTSLAEISFSCIALDANKNIWIGGENGIALFSLDQNSARHYNISEQFSSNIINFLQVDSDEKLWLGTDDGLFSLNLRYLIEHDSLVIKSYNEHDGVVGQECNQNAVFKDSQGQVWFGTNGGLIKHDPKSELTAESKILRIVLNDIQVNFESALDRLNLIAENDEENVFLFNENRITFRFSAIHYSNPEKIFFSYRLKGSDDQWSPPTQENYITYAHLSPGSYQFEVRSKLENHQWDSIIAVFKFQIEPPFYFRLWFIILSVLVLISLIYLIFRHFENQRMRKIKLVETQNRAKILGLEQQTLNAHMNRHFIFNALNSIQYYINTQDKTQANQYLTNFAALVRKNLDSAQVETISLRDELDRLQLYMNLEQMRFKDRFEFSIHMDAHLDAESLLVPSMILQPFVENSIMHGILPSERKGIISINISSANGDLRFELFDNGIGIENSLKQKSVTTAHVSNGMKITRQRMELLKTMTKLNYSVEGPFQAVSETGVIGTYVIITLPMQFR